MPTSITSSGITFDDATTQTTSALAAGAIGTTQLASAAVTPAKLSQPLTLSTSAPTTSGTSIDFTGIPSWVKRITVMFDGVSTIGTSQVVTRIGAGSITTSGYASSAANIVNTATSAGTRTDGFPIDDATSPSPLRSGIATLATLGSNKWVFSCVIGRADAVVSLSAGVVTLSGACDRVRLTTVNGTDTFDAGSVNIIYEG
jgi:hypothetical protein